MFYFVKPPWGLKKLYSSYIWSVPEKEKTLYLTFDDGPHETATPFILNELKKYNAQATFFCLGKNVFSYPAIYNRIVNEGHAVGNHTYNHLNGWKTTDKKYLQDIADASKYIDSDFFRPPYGKITNFQSKLINKKQERNKNKGESFVVTEQVLSFKIFMWSVLCGDFDTTISPAKCLQNILKNTKNGSIIVFHDSTKAWIRMSYALPHTLEFFSERGFQFKKLE